MVLHSFKAGSGAMASDNIRKVRPYLQRSCFYRRAHTSGQDDLASKAGAPFGGGTGGRGGQLDRHKIARGGQLATATALLPTPGSS